MLPTVRYTIFITYLATNTMSATKEALFDINEFDLALDGLSRVTHDLRDTVDILEAGLNDLKQIYDKYEEAEAKINQQV